MTDDVPVTFRLERRLFLILSRALALMMLVCLVLIFTGSGAEVTTKLVVGMVICAVFAFLFQRSYDLVNEIDICSDRIVFHPVGDVVPFSKIESIEIQSDRNGHIYGVKVRSHEPGRQWIPITLLWLGNDIQISLFGVDEQAMLMVLVDRYTRYQAHG